MADQVLLSAALIPCCQPAMYMQGTLMDHRSQGVHKHDGGMLPLSGAQVRHHLQMWSSLLTVRGCWPARRF